MSAGSQILIILKCLQTGIYVDFIVWPAVLLHNNGAVLQKGVVQPLDERLHRPQQ